MKRNKAKHIALSMTPNQHEWAVGRAKQVRMGFSAYVQALVEHDQKKDILPDVMRRRLAEQLP